MTQTRGDVAAAIKNTMSDIALKDILAMNHTDCATVPSPTYQEYDDIGS